MRTEIVLIVAKTRHGAGACIGGITAEGRSVRLVAPDAATNERAGLEYEVGEVWKVQAVPDRNIVPPHTENIIVQSKVRLRTARGMVPAICRFMPPRQGGPEVLYDGLAQPTESGALYVAEHGKQLSYSTMFWQPDQALVRDDDAKRIRYRYPTPDGGRTLTFVGFQEPVSTLAAGTLLRVSLAHWWRPSDKPSDEPRCYVQLSGWFLDAQPCEQPEDIARRDSAPATIGAASGATPDQIGGILEEAQHLLKRVFGYETFWPLQAEVIGNLLQGRDTLAIMPTGGGKSLCYQLPALMFSGLTVVVSPLISLMQDQVDALDELGVPAVYLNSTLNYTDYLHNARRVRNGSAKLLYVAPETLLRPETLVLLDHAGVSCFTIDEAHCISAWGHDFRPEYRQLLPVRDRYREAVCLALTATATPHVQNDIVSILGFRAANTLVAGFDRPNLYLAAASRQDGMAQTLEFLEAHRDQPGIIYCSTRQQVDDLTTQLVNHGWSALPYHAGLEDQARQRHQRAFIRDDVDIIVATVAFGMGIDKSNVRFVLHYNLPKDIESYYQEIGRAGRDGARADCLLLHSPKDIRTIRHFLEEGAESERSAGESRLKDMIRYAGTHVCRRKLLLGYFGDTSAGTPCGMCDNCLAAARSRDLPDAAFPEQEMTDITVPAQKFLECVRRTGERFGAMHVIRVLRGSKAKEVLGFQHDRLPVYGTGSDLSEIEWRRLVDASVDLGLVERDPETGVIRVTSAGREVLQGNRILAPVATAGVKQAGPVADTTYDANLFRALRTLRKELADAAGIPPYVIFSDRTLMYLAGVMPRTPAQFLAVYGVGQRKLEAYGDLFLALIAEHIAAGGPSELAAIPAGPSQPAPILANKPRTQHVAELFAAGLSIPEIQQVFGVQRNTIIHHLHQFLQAGGALPAASIRQASSLDSTDMVRVEEAFVALGHERLTPVFEHLNGEVPYEELHLMRLLILAGQHWPPVFKAAANE